MHKQIIAAILAAGLLLLPLLSRADDSPPSQDAFDYSYLQINRLSEHSDFFRDRSAGNGLKFAYDFQDAVYLFGQWSHLNFNTLPGFHDLAGAGIGAHQAYSPTTSFHIDLAYLRDRLSGGLGGGTDNYWRVSYGFRSHLNGFIEFDGAIFTERNTDFGRRPFGERLGLGFGGRAASLILSGEHTADGNRMEAALNWYFK